LNHAAERGVVHRDIKPSNILITPDGRAKIVDMGLARQLDSEAVNGGVTQSGVTLGTFDYISPEQALDPRRADVRSDIYSLGCTFYHALTGRPPVPEGTAARKLRAHQNEEPLDPRELNSAIPDELAAVLARMMAKDPTQRYQTPLELIAHLKGLVERLRNPGGCGRSSSAARSATAASVVGAGRGWSGRRGRGVRDRHEQPRTRPRCVGCEPTHAEGTGHRSEAHAPTR
jgi:serine/threonine protein kinase